MNILSTHPNNALARRKLGRFAAAAAAGVAGLLVGTVAVANNVHFAGKINAEQIGDKIIVTGKVAGLGKIQPLAVTVTVVGTVEVTCTNPSGVNQPPGQNKFGAQAVQEIAPEDFNKAGNVNFEVAVDVPESGNVAGAPGCPNPKWTQNQVVEIDEITIVAQQGNQTATAVCLPSGTGFNCRAVR